MASNYWIKLYHEMLHDPKVMRLPDHLFRRWVELLLSAGEENSAGALPPVADMAWVLRTTPEDLLMDLAGLERAGLIEQGKNGWLVSRFADRQAPVSDADRMRKLRDRRHRAEYYGDAPESQPTQRASYAPVTNRNTDADTDTEADVEADTEKAAAAPTPCAKILSEHGIILNGSYQSDKWHGLYTDYGETLFIAAIDEASRSSPGVPTLNLVTAILKRCKAEGVMPGEWKDRRNGQARASPSPPPKPAPTTWRNPISGKVETV